MAVPGSRGYGSLGGAALPLPVTVLVYTNLYDSEYVLGVSGIPAPGVRESIPGGGTGVLVILYA